MRRWFRRKRKREPLDLEDVNEQLQLRYFWLLVKQMEHDKRVRNKAIRLSRKNKQQPWVI